MVVISIVAAIEPQKLTSDFIDELGFDLKV